MYNQTKETYRQKIMQTRMSINSNKTNSAPNKNEVIWEVINQETKARSQHQQVELTPDEINDLFTNVGSTTTNTCQKDDISCSTLLNKTYKYMKNSIFLKEITPTEMIKITKLKKQRYSCTTRSVKNIGNSNEESTDKGFPALNFFCTKQNGFMDKRSVVSAISVLLNEVADAFDCRNKGKLLSKALDSINHHILIQKLQFYGINDATLE
ncbi:hypothetical protein HHI36_004009 [Cryptolaemus montrouzieri]|uniref:Uncharacterized protein n=1 Tax=Cryptolaemus montrouzieri TaxID=559131 RepID=A0ABD2NPX0_9CUCU